MRTTVTLDDQLLERAGALSGVREGFSGLSIRNASLGSVQPTELSSQL